MSNRSLTSAPAAQRPERGLGYALMGGLGITLLAVLLGAAYWLWFYTSQRSASPAELLPVDTQIYVSLAPSLGDIPEGAQVASVLREQIGVSDPEHVRNSAVNLLGVDYNNNILTWIGGTMVVAVRNFTGQGQASAERLLREGEVIFILGSRNDPQASAFIEKHLAARAARGDLISKTQVGTTTVYVQEGDTVSSITAFTLFEHYIIFSNRPEAITAMIAQRDRQSESLASLPSFTLFSEALTPRIPGGRYSSGGDAPQAALAALRDLLTHLDQASGASAMLP